MKYELTKKSKRELYDSGIGTGVVYLHTKDNEFIAFEFGLAVSGKFIAGNKEISKYLEDLKSEIEVEENE
jgi:hypothetical protein